MAPSEKIKALVDQMPTADNRGMYCHMVAVEAPGVADKKGKGEPKPVTKSKIDKAQIEKAVEEIQKGGRESVVGVIDMLVEPGQGEDYKARYALHCVAVQVCKMKQAGGGDGPRSEFALALASQLGGNRPKGVQAYLLQELQTAGGKESVAAMGKLLTDDDLSDWAARALVSIGDGAVEQFRAALPQAKGKSRLTIIQNLGVLCDAKSADAMRAALKDTDREIRIAGARGLAKIGDAGAADLLLKAADGSQGWERIQMTKFCLVLAENLTAAGRKADAAKIYTQLRDTRKDPSEKYISELAARALAAAK
jgi:hypothetical protein